MPIRNLWALEPDEVLVADKLSNLLPDCHIYFPTRDTGVDILVAKGKKHLGIQVKGSRYYTSRKDSPLPPERHHSWHQIKAKSIGQRGEADFYVFVTHIPTAGKHRVDEFEQKYLVVPTDEIKRRVRAKRAGKNQIYSFYFRFEDSHVVEIREDKKGTSPLSDYSEFLGKWERIRGNLA